MFGLMKNLMKEAPPPGEAATLADLHVGCVLGFGFMPQKNLSGKRVPVAEVNSYLFDTDMFHAYRVTNDSVDVNLIVADEDDPTGTYLALSQKIEPRLYDAFFAGTPPKGWFSLREGDVLTARPPVLGGHQGWLTSRYTLALVMPGRYLEGDWHLRKPADRGRFSKAFDYLLFVDDDNEYAVEAERYEDGTIHAYATIYRPATDIGEITRAPKALSYGSVESIPHDPVKDSGIAEVKRDKPPAPYKASLLSDPKPVPKAETKVEAPKAESPKVEASKADLSKEALPKEQMTITDKEVKAAEAILSASVAPPQTVQTLPLASSQVIDAIAAPEPETKAEPVAKTPEAGITKPAAPESKSAPVEVKPTEPKSLEVKPADAGAADIKQANDKPEPLLPAAVKPEAAELQVKPATASPEQPAETAKPKPAETKAAEASPAKPEVALYGKFGRIRPAASVDASASPEGTLRCDMGLAARLIDEAQRNHMPLSEVVRKVIDLPAKVDDLVYIPFTLDPSELAELARRYQLAATDDEGIKRRIVEELKRFIGEKI